MDRKTAFTAVAAVLTTCAAWDTFERIYFLLPLLVFLRHVPPASVPGVGFVRAQGLENLVTTVFSLMAWWGVAALAWLTRAQAQDVARATTPPAAGEQSGAEWPPAPS